MHRTLTTCFIGITLLTTSGCDRRLSIGALHGDEGSANGEAGTDDAGREDGGADGGTGGVGECDRTGPLLNVGDGAGPACAGGGSSRAFRYVACSCDDLINNASIVSDAFGTAKTPNNLTNGSVGINGSFYPLITTLSGSLVVAGGNGIPTKGNLTVAGDLRDQGQLDGQFDIVVDGNAEVGGDVRVKSLSLGGTLTVSNSSTVDVTDANPPALRSEVNIAPPCDCSTGPDITALTRAAEIENDNAAVGLDPQDGLKALNAPIELTLPCGRYYVDELYAPNPITLTITGRVALYIGGDLVTELGGPLRFQLAPGAELDLLVGNNTSAGDAVELGSAATQGRARLYVGGTGSLFFAGNTLVAGTVYAPKAELVASATFEVFGAVLARRMSTAGVLKLHYDRSLSDGSCEDTP